MNRFSSFFIFLLGISLCSVSPLVSRPVESAGSGSSILGDVLKDAAHTGAIIAIIGLLERNDHTEAACVLGGIALLSELEKQNPKFFNSTINVVSAPWIYVRKGCERLFCNGESLSWNELVTWRNRIHKLLSPLTKQTTVADLSREKRLRLIDKEDNEEAVLDEQWAEYVQHVDQQCTFMIKRLDKHLNYYQDRENKKLNRLEKECTCVTCVFDKTVVSPFDNAVSTVGKACVRASIKRNEEIAFYLGELKVYLQEIITYIKSVMQLSSLDKDRVKRVMNGTCDTFEHVATLVDADTAAAGRNAVGQLTVQKESSGHSYGGGYGQNAF